MAKYMEKLVKLEGMEIDRKKYLYYVAVENGEAFLCRSIVTRRGKLIGNTD